MHVIRQTSAAVVHATTPYGLCGMLLFAGTSAKLTDAAGRDVMGLPAAGGSIMLQSPIQVTGLTSVGTFSDLYIFVE